MFLKPIMLAGLGAAVIPLALHLLSKARYRTIEWGAMMFLQPAKPRLADSTRLKQAAILGLRMSLIAALALALARPVLRAGAGTTGGESRIHAIIILDRSASMRFVENGRPRFAAAKQAVINILSNLHRGDEVSLVLTGDPVDPGQVQPTTDLQSIATRVGSLQPSYGRANFAAALEEVRQALAREPAAAHELYMVCDSQSNSWEDVNQRVAETWQKTVAGLSSPLRFYVLPVGTPQIDNIAVESIRLPGPAPVRQIPAPVQIELRNYGPIPRSDLPLTLLCNGEPIAKSIVNIAADSSATQTCWVTFPSSGSQVISAHIDSTTFPEDDTMDRAVNVLDPARVLVISGEARTNGMRGSADYVRMALSPHEVSGASGMDPASVRVIGVDDWWGISPDRDDVVILTNVGQLSDDQIRQLEQFAYGGGSIVFAPGDLTDIQSVTDDLYREGEGFLPANFKSTPAQTTATRLSQVEVNHPIFHFLHEHRESISEATVSRSLDLDDRAGDARVIASFANGKPFLIERPYGRGRVLMFTTTLGTQWNRIPETRIYLPLMQSAVRYLAASGLPDRNLRPSEPIELTYDHAPAQNAAIVTLPSGAQRRVPVVQSGQRWTVRFNDTSSPGIYEVLFAGNASRYVVSAPRVESDPTPLSTERLSWLQNSLKFRRVDAQKDPLTAIVTAQRTGTELHLPLIACVVLLALGEMALARVWSYK